MQKHKAMTGKKFKPGPYVASGKQIIAMMTAICTMNGKVTEPNKRMCAGRYGWVSHRFQINGGIDPSEVMYQEMREKMTPSNQSFLMKLKSQGAYAQTKS